jgi:ABC-type sugar transport system permease subunit
MRSLFLKLGALAFIDAFGILLAVSLGSAFGIIVAIAVILFTALINAVFLVEGLYPWRWMTPGVALLLLMVIFPLVYTIEIAFTNFGGTHLLSRDQALADLTSRYYKPDNPVYYKVTVYKSPAGAFKFWLIDTDGKTYIGSPDVEGLQDPASASGLGDKDSNGIPASIGDFKRLSSIETLQALKPLRDVIIKAAPYTIVFRDASSVDRVPKESLLYTYNAADDSLTDSRNGHVYHVEKGEFVYHDGDNVDVLTPGFSAFIGLDNFTRIISSDSIREPFIRVFIWTFVFAIGTVFTVFTLGLTFALTLNAKDLPFRPIFRALIILPYALPSFISILIWRGLFEPNYGWINQATQTLFHVSPNWLADPTLAKIMILLVNLWLGYPYMMLITLGALQSIPSDVYEAARMDGADTRQQFQFITLPLLLVSVGPLLIGSFSFNFNNYALIELLTQGGPPLPGASVAGQTDILISYTVRLAFGSGKGNDYGLGSAIAIIIFLIIAAITVFNFRFTRQFEQVSENV